MSQPKSKPITQAQRMSYLYNPANQSYQQLLDGFVVRKKEFKRIMSDLTSADFDNSAQHYLIEGQRGTGKTSLLLRVRYEIERNADFEHLLVVQFAEEQYNIFDLCRLWESTAEALEDVAGFEGISDEMDQHNEDDDYRQECFGFIERQLVKHNKRLVLLLDNFGDILDRFSDIEQKRLRDIFHNSSHIQLIASSSRSLEHTYKHDKPFFEFFKTIKLTGLNKKDVNTLLLTLAEHNPVHASNMQHIMKTQPQRLETIRRLTGGIPRTIVLLFEIFADESADVFEDLELILDRVTPLYKHRMDDLATQQQAIMDTIALSWDGISSKEIVHGLKKRGFNSKTVSAQLISLSKNGLVESKNIDKKNKLYFIRERFFNIWYLMRYGRKKNKDQVKWLVRFLQQWCSDDELNSRAQRHIACAKSGRLNSRGGYIMAEALGATLTDRDIQHEVLTETKKALRKSDPDIDRKLGKSDLEMFTLAGDSFHNGDFELAKKYSKVLAEKGDVLSMFNLAWLYQEKFKDADAAITYYKMSIEKGDKISMFNLALLYAEEFRDFDSAVTYYKMAIENGDVKAMHNLAALYQIEFKDFDAAISCYKMAIEKDDVDAINNLAWLYYLTNRHKVESLVLIKKSHSTSRPLDSRHTLATILLWNDHYQQSVETIKEIILDEQLNGYLDSITDYFLLLLSKKQYHLALELFNQFETLKNQFKPIYYALMILLKDEYPKEHLKMGSELEDTVNEILVEIENKPQK
jgi:TPR repeat protein